jgi:hypothetical protein
MSMSVVERLAMRGGDAIASIITDHEFKTLSLDERVLVLHAMLAPMKLVYRMVQGAEQSALFFYALGDSMIYHMQPAEYYFKVIKPNMDKRKPPPPEPSGQLPDPLL